MGMQEMIRIIKLPLPFHMGYVNCYLITTDPGFLLIDTGSSSNRKELIRELESAGCKAGQLSLIVLTHGDFDHTGNAAYLRNVYSCKVAMHEGDLGMVESGDMFVNRNKPNIIIQELLPLFSRFGKAERFTPDLIVKDVEDLSGYGLDGKIISIPGHSRGSIAILAAGGELFCGDLLVNTEKPELNSLMDDGITANASLQKLENMNISMVYPGHGLPFPLHGVGK
jgi:hydroxyacylglutathione hydrolase